MVIFTSHVDGMCNILLTLPGTTDFDIQNIVNLRTVLAKSAFAVTSNNGDFFFFFFFF